MSNTSKGDVLLKLSLSLLYFNKTLLHKSSERSSLSSGPELSLSPEAKNPSIFHGLATTFQHLLISWLQSPSAVILESKKIKSVTVSIVSPSICHEAMGPDAIIFTFWMLSFNPTFSLSSFTFIKRLFNSSLLSALRVVSSAYLRLLIFLPAILIPACTSSTSS